MSVASAQSVPRSLTEPVALADAPGQEDPVVLVIHGGAGTITQDRMTDEREASIRASLETALRAGHARLMEGGSALDVVEATIHPMEDDPNFNAGRGGVFAADGTVRHDASIMDGATGMAGASSNTQHVRHPISLARKVMEESPHVMLTADGAEEFALLHDLEMITNTYFHTPGRRASLERVQAREREAMAETGSAEVPMPEEWQMMGTVGAVALDAEGHIAAGTSTGGMTNKKWGRVGDSPIIGAGTFADARCGVSATGHGEYFIRLAVAHDIAARVAYLGETCAEAAEHVIMTTLTEAGGTGGVIVLDSEGNASLPFNTEGMYRGTITRSGVIATAMYGQE
ncbi:MAG: isoaspartyl peptidase/L-asparaginase [Bacteroidota bacterium]